MSSTAGSSFASHFGIENIPFGIASTKDDPPQCVTRFEDNVIFLSRLEEDFTRLGVPKGTFSKPTLNAFASLGRDVHRKTRQAIQVSIKNGLLASCQIHISKVQVHLPVAVGDFTDFSCSPSHNRNAGQALLGQSGALPPGFHHMPLGYAGRCSSIKVSGSPVRRPRGQFFQHGAEGLRGTKPGVVYGPSENLDYELEMGVVVGKPVPDEGYVTATQAAEHVFGFVLLSDWSARDIQQLEMIPVGPLNSKHAATSVSPWIVTPDALRPYTVPTPTSETPLAPHLHDPNGKLLAVDVQANISSAGEANPRTVCSTSTKVMSWTFEQLIAHQSSSGCGLRTGDLLGIGTISGASESEQGCLLEQFVPGKTSRRSYLQDGETVQLVGYCGQGVGFGECSGQILPALDQSRWP